MQDFTAHGRVGLSWYDAGARSFYARQPVRSLNDLQGKTIRVQDSQIVIDMIRLLGAVPETTAYSDVYSAFETGRSMPPKTTGRPTIPWSTTRWRGTTWPMSTAAYRRCSWLPATHGMHCRRNTSRFCRNAPGIGAIRAPALGTGRNCRPRSGIGWRVPGAAAARRRNAELPAAGTAAVPEILCRLSAAGGRDTGRMTTEKVL